MGGTPNVPSQQDPNVLAERERRKSVILSQVYAQKMASLGQDSTVLGGKPNTTLLGDYGNFEAPKLLPTTKKEVGNKAWLAANKATGQNSAGEINMAFNDYNTAMAYRARKREGLI